MTEQLPRKYRFRAHGRTLVLAKRPEERAEHRLMMALLWARYLPEYPNLTIDVPVRDRYRPDLVDFDAGGDLVFWGECGAVSAEKIAYLCRRYPRTHLVFGRWERRPAAFAALIERGLRGVRRSAPIELYGFDDHTLEWVSDTGEITVPAEWAPYQRWDV